MTTPLWSDINEMDSTPGVEVSFPDPDDLMRLYVNITPLDGIYAGAKFRFRMEIPDNFPFAAPKVRCETLVRKSLLRRNDIKFVFSFLFQVYHPNIDFEGAVCLNILRQEWSPVLSLQSVIFGLLTLFSVCFQILFVNESV